MIRHRFPQCTKAGKVRFGEHKDATQALREARRAAGRDGVSSRRRETRSYQCSSCRGWHLTSQLSYVEFATSSSAGAGDGLQYQAVA